MAQWFRVLATALKDLGLIRSTQQGSLLPPVTPVPGIQRPLLSSVGTRHIHGTYILMQEST